MVHDAPYGARCTIGAPSFIWPYSLHKKSLVC